MAKAQSAWEEARALHPDVPLVRIIDVKRGLQFFMALNPIRERREEASVWDGATILTPNTEASCTTQEWTAIVAAADAAWQEAH